MKESKQPSQWNLRSNSKGQLSLFRYYYCCSVKNQVTTFATELYALCAHSVLAILKLTLLTYVIMPEILQKLKSELKSVLPRDHDETGNASSRDAQRTATPDTGGGVIPADDVSGHEQSTAATHSGRQTLRKAAEAEGAGTGAGAKSGSAKKIHGLVPMTLPSGGVIRSEEAHGRDRTQSDRMTLRKAAAHDRGDDPGLGA